MERSETEVWVIGVGELGGVLAKGFLRCGHRVCPVLRGQALPAGDPEAVLVAVGEGDLAPVLETLPPSLHGRAILIQNELLPGSWACLQSPPTVASVWFEKKPAIVAHAIQSTPVSGPKAGLFIAAMNALSLPAHEVDEAAMLDALVVKNLYILTANVAGLELPEGTTTGALWHDHRERAEAIAAEVLVLQRALLARQGSNAPGDGLVDAMGAAFVADPKHKAKGRSAPARLARALTHGAELGVDTPILKRISESL